jgi:signal transduction histidine kinase
MKKISLFLILLLFSLPFFARDFSDIYSDFYQADFSEAARVDFYQNLQELKNQDDTLFVLQDNQQAKANFDKIAELSSHPMNEADIKAFQFYAYEFSQAYVSCHITGEHLLTWTITGFCILILFMIFLLRYAVNKEEKYRKLKNLSEITKAVEEATIQIQDSERSALYQTLHDTVSQNTKAEQIFTEKLEPFISKDAEARELYDSIKKIQNANLTEVRNILNTYNSVPQKDLCQNITELCTTLKNSTRLDIKLMIQNQAAFANADPKEKENIYNIIKEAVNNAFRHARCERISVILRTDSKSAGKSARKIRLIIDDGKGFDQNNVDKASHHGLEIMKKRAELIGGICTIKSEVDSGTEISVEW